MDQHESAEKAAIVGRHGPWIGYNLELADGEHTIGADLVGAADANIRRVVQLVADHARRPLPELRILDLGCHEGGFSIELARQGSDVVGIEAREAHFAKACYAKDVLGLSNVEFVRDDVRRVSVDQYGRFDVVLCLGILYHLPAPDVVPFLEQVAGLCARMAFVETQVSLTGREEIKSGDRSVRGHFAGENPRDPGAALDDTRSFWLTLPSLLNVLADNGFTSAVECLSPPVLPLASLADHVTLLATKGKPVALRSLPAVNRLPAEAWRWPEGGRGVAHFSHHPRRSLRGLWARGRERRFDDYFADALAKRPSAEYVERWTKP
jgi:SAM-dependent methyltransferase